MDKSSVPLNPGDCIIVSIGRLKPELVFYTFESFLDIELFKQLESEAFFDLLCFR